MTIESHFTSKTDVPVEYQRMLDLELKRGLNQSEQNYLRILQMALLFEVRERQNGDSRDNPVHRKS